MSTKRLTKTVAESLRAGDRAYVVWDHGAGAVRGFGLKVLPSGRKVAVYQYRLKGAGRRGITKRFTIGELGPGLLFAKAKGIAEKLRASVIQGGDPSHDEKVLALALVQRDAEAKERSFEVLAESWLRTKLNLRSYGELERIVNNHLAGLHKKAVADLNPAELESLVRDIELGKGAKKRAPAPVMAFHTLGVLRRVLDHGIKKRWIAQNPTASIEVNLGLPVGGRDRVLSDDELVNVWSGAETMGYPYGKAVQLLILTAARRSEVIKLDWAELDLCAKLWRLPAERSKNGIAHDIHLSSQAIGLLLSLPAAAHGELPKSGPVFSNYSEKPIAGLSKYKRRLDELSGVTHWRIHDIRRTVATGLREMGVSLDVTERILNHKGQSRTGIAAVYDKSALMEPRKRALLDWGAHVVALVESHESDENVLKNA